MNSRSAADAALRSLKIFWNCRIFSVAHDSAASRRRFRLHAPPNDFF
jgi:hypothetical protein